MTGEGIPFRKLGFDSLGSFLETLSDTLIVRRLPTGGMMVALAGTGQHRTAANNIRNLKGSRNMSNPESTQDNVIMKFNVMEFPTSSISMMS